MRLLTTTPLNRSQDLGKAPAKAGWAAGWLQRLRFLAVAFLLVAQFTLALHQLGHHATVVTNDTCATCHLTSNMAAGPAAVTVTPYFIVERRGPEDLTQLIPARIYAGFRSRAPPSDFRI